MWRGFRTAVLTALALPLVGATHPAAAQTASALSSNDSDPVVARSVKYFVDNLGGLRTPKIVDAH